jgi:predicted XRE-type DNA-binding protein
MAKDPNAPIPLARYRGVVESTGEVIDIDAPAVRGRRRKGRRKMYGLVDLEMQARLELTGQEWTVLHTIMAAVNGETNEARISIVEIAERLNIAQSNVSRIMKTLRDRRIIFTLRIGVHRVNTHLMFRGSNQDWDIATETEREPQWVRS